jgi:hypothetical protein
MSSKKFLITTFLTIIFYNVGRLIGWTFLSQTALWDRLINDNLHHYQLGILLILICVLFYEKIGKWRGFILAISSGMVIDESMYLFYSLNKNFSHYSIVGITFEFLVFIIFARVILRFRPLKR